LGFGRFVMRGSYSAGRPRTLTKVGKRFGSSSGSVSLSDGPEAEVLVVETREPHSGFPIGSVGFLISVAITEALAPKDDRGLMYRGSPAAAAAVNESNGGCMSPASSPIPPAAADAAAVAPWCAQGGGDPYLGSIGKRWPPLKSEGIGGTSSVVKFQGIGCGERCRNIGDLCWGVSCCRNASGGGCCGEPIPPACAQVWNPGGKPSGTDDGLPSEMDAAGDPPHPPGGGGCQYMVEGSLSDTPQP